MQHHVIRVVQERLTALAIDEDGMSTVEYSVVPKTYQTLALLPGCPNNLTR